MLAVAGLVLGCAWTVYTNVLGASIYPSVNSAAFEAPVVKNSAVVAARPVQPAFNEIFASLEQRPLVMPAPENVAELADVQRAVCRVGRRRANRPEPLRPDLPQTTELAEASPPVEVPKAARHAEAG